ncbi:MAG: 3-hydroxyacyl-ACP dehydratase FabZ [Pseudomonadota bacterium]
MSLPIGTVEIRKLLPHRFPFLLVDRVVAFEPGTSIRAYKNVTVNEEFFQGHFPTQPVMPGVLVIEALAQAGGLLYQLTSRTGGGAPCDDKLFYLVKVDNARFSRMIVPGDRLDLDVSLKRRIRNMALYEGVASVDGQEAARAEILCAEAQN